MNGKIKSFKVVCKQNPPKSRYNTLPLDGRFQLLNYQTTSTVPIKIANTIYNVGLMQINKILGTLTRASSETAYVPLSVLQYTHLNSGILNIFSLRIPF